MAPKRKSVEVIPTRKMSSRVADMNKKIEERLKLEAEAKATAQAEAKAKAEAKAEAKAKTEAEKKFADALKKTTSKQINTQFKKKTSKKTTTAQKFKPENIKIVIRAIKFKGELFDLTITTKNNLYGEKKIECARKNGISFPLDYYYDEIYKMTDDTKDHKFLKRMERLTFLENLKRADSEKQSIQNFFKMYVNYLNGSDGINNHSSKLILVVAGGNIITLFANLLNIISELPNNDSRIIEDFLRDYLNGITIDSKLKTFIIEIKQLLEKNESLINDIRYVSSRAFSDLDFNLLPNNIEHKMEGGVHPVIKKKLTRMARQLRDRINFRKTQPVIAIKGPFMVLPNRPINIDPTRSNYNQDKYFESINEDFNENFDENTILLESIYDNIDDIEELKEKRKEISQKLSNKGNNDSDIYYNKLQLFLINKRIKTKEAEIKKEEGKLEAEADELLLETKPVETETETETVKKKEKTDGFFVFRVKTKYSLDKNHLYSAKPLLSDKFNHIKKLYNKDYILLTENHCKDNSDILASANVSLIPNLITQESIESAKSKINPDCYKFLEKLLAKKHVMDFSTTENTKNITEFDIDSEISDPVVIIGGTIDDHQKTKNMIKNIRSITSMLNKKLKDLQPTMSANENNFDDLEAMSESKLPLIGASLVQTFLDSPFFKSLNDKLKNNYTQNKFDPLPSSFNIVHPFTDYTRHLHKYYNPWENEPDIDIFKQNNAKYSNIHATINIVQPLYIKNIDTEIAEGKKNKNKKKKKKTKKKSRKKSRKNLRKIFKKTIKKVKLLTKKCKTKKHKNTKTCKKFNEIKIKKI